jgi:hypothetical protein
MNGIIRIDLTILFKLNFLMYGSVVTLDFLKIIIQSDKHNKMGKNAQDIMKTPVGYQVILQNIDQIRGEGK